MFVPPWPFVWSWYVTMTCPLGPTAVSPWSPFPLNGGTGSGAEKSPCWPRPLTLAPEASTLVEGKLDQLTQTLFGPAAIDGWSALKPPLGPRRRLDAAFWGVPLPV